jgi:hypothetical protein
MRMNKKSSPNNIYGLPEDFLDYIYPYVRERQSRIPETSEELMAIWEEGIKYIRLYPELQENIAAWTMSVGSRSPLVDDNDIFEAIHLEIGCLETPQWVYKKTLEEALIEIEDHIKIARSGSKKKWGVLGDEARPQVRD